MLSELVTGTSAPTAVTRQIAVVCFAIEDQAGGDLAIALDELRRLPDVLDVVQIPVFGKQRAGQDLVTSVGSLWWLLTRASCPSLLERAHC